MKAPSIQDNSNSYVQFLKAIKENIVRSRYLATRLANKEQLLLYLRIGKMISEKISVEKWGTKMIDKISTDLQLELPGLKGFSTGNLKKMRIFYEAYSQDLIGSTVSNQLGGIDWEDIFYGISFSHHFTILTKVKDWEERLFYIRSASENFWSLSVLEYHLESQLYQNQGKLTNNFGQTLTGQVRSNALKVFQDEYLFDYLRPETFEERALESEIIVKIRDFIMKMGKGFAFIGNQYRLVVDNDDFFIDLLFYNRHLQCLVAFDLKRNKFQPKDVGQLNFYLNVLDEKIRLPHENPAIGIILCKEKNDAVVEFSIKSMDKAMGVATYRTTKLLPEEIKMVLPDANDLINLL